MQTSPVLKGNGVYIKGRRAISLGGFKIQAVQSLDGNFRFIASIIGIRRLLRITSRTYKSYDFYTVHRN